MNAPSRAEIETRARAGDTAAQLALADICEREHSDESAVEWLRRAAKAGNRDASLVLGKRFLTREPYIGQPKLVQEGIALTLAAAKAGDAEALHAAAMLTAGGLGMRQDWNAGFDYLKRSAEGGFALAGKELAMLAPSDGAIDIAPWLEIPQPYAISQTPRIAVIRNFLDPRLCDWLIERARPRLDKASLYDPLTGARNVSEGRNNSAVMFSLFDMDMVLLFQWMRIAKAIGMRGSPEFPNVLHYAVGQRYAPHFDFIEPNIAGDARALTQGGQRVLTFLVYLNEGYDGGETEFPLIQLRFKGNKGDVLFFWNVDPAGQPDRMTLHTGTAPTSGEKWLLSQWIDA